ncbi:MAG: hypothetical protein EA385_03555 [Salinarimonadaceae bacterium]|nr:MAG: hypothetical protein EA385_03555 [Salinarimonadaceae bacterium]
MSAPSNTALSHTERLRSADAFRDWFATLRRIHSVAGLVVIGLVSIVFSVAFEPGPAFQLAVAATLILLLSLPHAVLDQYSAFVALKPLMGGLWPIGFLSIYGGCTILALLLWVHAPAFAAALFLGLAALHYGLADLADRGVMRALELVARGFAPFALALLFNPEPVAALVGWLILDLQAGGAFVHDVALPAAMVWQVVWALVVARQLYLAMARSQWRPALVAAEMSMQVLAFATLPPLIAFMLFATLMHAPRHVFDFARRNPWLGDPPRALLRVIRATVVPTALAVGGMAAAGYWALGAPATDTQLVRMAIWLLTAFAAPHAVLTFLALRRFGGLIETEAPGSATAESSITR